MAETQKTRDDLAAQAWRGQGGHWRLSETAETPVVWLITQRSRVQIPPRLLVPQARALFRWERAFCVPGAVVRRVAATGLRAA
jgi:hypothetical protein